MKDSLKQIFGKNKNIIIGALHFPPLLGYSDFPGFNICIKNALADLNAFVLGGVDGIIFENNYDIPHHIKVKPETIVAMSYLGEQIVRASSLPLGVSTLWNDYQVSLSIAKTLNLKFIRIPVFVDRVKTSCGVVDPSAYDVKKYRHNIEAENVLLFTDIHVKHSKLLSKYSLHQSAKLAIKRGSDALILTGAWTGQAPDMDQLKRLRKTVGNFPIFIGSGVDDMNIRRLLQYANGVIVSTSLKEGSSIQTEINVKTWRQRISSKKVKNIVNKLEII